MINALLVERSGVTLDEFVQVRRAKDMSWEDITRELYLATVGASTITTSTLFRWYRDSAA